MTLVDNNVLSSLAKIDRLALLDAVFDQVSTSVSVLDELHSDAVSGYSFVDRIDEVKQYEGGWLRVVSPTDAGIQLTAEILDPSLSYTDAELIAIAENRTKRLLTDDKHVGEVASTRGVDTWDLTLFLRAACKVEAIETQEQLQSVLSDLRQKDFYEFSDEDEQYLFCSF
jgi:predicted nucleic acid-binding protein